MSQHSNTEMEFLHCPCHDTPSGQLWKMGHLTTFCIGMMVGMCFAMGVVLSIVVLAANQ